MIYSKEFLKKLDLDRNRIIFARITALQFNESPIESIEGKVTQGSITLDGNSAVRRSCSLSIVTNKVDVSNYIWSLNTKFKLEIGLKNNVDSNYPDIIWFNQGTYLISSFSSALATNSFTINIQGKDKMCQLNGEIGGTLTSSVDFGKLEQIDEEGNVRYIPQLIKDIIREAVHTYGREPFHNIIINDLDSEALMMQEYRYNEPLYLLRRAQDVSGEYERAILNGNTPCVYKNGMGTSIAVPLKEIPIFDSLTTTFEPNSLSATQFYITSDADTIIEETTGQPQKEPQYYCAAKIEYGQAVGFTETELTYTGDLIANIGETITSVLDKIKNMLGDFEYFYNVDGQFVFQKKKTYLNTAWSPSVYEGESEDQVSVINSEENSYTYSLLGNELLISLNTTPNIANLKNDYSVWGTRSSNGSSLPIHMRYAIHQKPIMYTTIQVNDEELIEYNKKYHFGLVGQNSVTYLAGATKHLYNSSEKIIYLDIQGEYTKETKLLKLAYGFEYNEESKTLRLKIKEKTLNENKVILCDWRELIYQMALDFRKYNHLDDFQLRVAAANPDIYPSGNTGYEQYYIDMEGFWRQLYNQEKQYDKNYNIEENKQYYKEVIEYKPLQEKTNGIKYYYNATENTQSAPLYERVMLVDYVKTDEGSQYVFAPLQYNGGEGIIEQTIYEKNSQFVPMTQEELNSLVLFPGENLKNLFIVKDYGLAKDNIQEENEYYIFQEIAADDYNSYQFYTITNFEDIDENTSIKEIVNVPVREAGKVYYSITQVMDLSLINDNTRLYTKIPYLFYKQIPLKHSNNTLRENYYKAIKCQDNIFYDDVQYYENKGLYISPELTELNVTERDDLRILPTYNALNSLLKFYSESGTNALFTLQQKDLQFLKLAIKKLLYIQYVLYNDTNETPEPSEKKVAETIETVETKEIIPSKEDYEEFLNKYYNFIEKLNKKFKAINTEFDSYNYKAFMSQTEFDEFYKQFEIYIRQIIDDIQLICYLYSEGKKSKEHIDFYEFLYGPVIKFAQFDTIYPFDYPTEAEINSSLHYVNQLDHGTLQSLQEIITTTQAFKNRLVSMQNYLNTHDFIPMEHYGLALNIDTYNPDKYFYIEPAMCYSVSNEYYLDMGHKQYWHRNVYEAPQLLNFWIEFLDTTGDLGQFAVQNIGSRQKVNNDNTVKSIYYRNAPLVIFSSEGEEQSQTGYRYINKIEGSNIKEHIIIKNESGNPYCKDSDIKPGAAGKSTYKITDPYDKKEYLYWKYDEVVSKTGTKYAWRGQENNNIYTQLFSVSSQGKSAKDAIDTLLYNHSYCTESVSITSIPIYHLQPNTRIYVYDNDTGVEGEYILTQMTIPLAYNGTMTITATKAVDRII